ncbi:MAG: AAA family ATPase [Lachnospiraceae bacterium]|nr:AAA family ATPase [Lachnospiraceae bacterium]
MENTFIARISLNYSFAHSRMEELGKFWFDVLNAIPEETNAELAIYRFTFATFVLDAETKEECRQILHKAWNETFPEENGICDILISSYERLSEKYEDIVKSSENNGKKHSSDPEKTDEDDVISWDDKELEDELEPLPITASKLTRAIYDNMYGIEDYQRLITELNETIPVLREKNALGVLFSQNYFVSIDGGCGFTVLINSLGNYLHLMGVFPASEYKNRNYYIELKLGKDTENGFTNADSVMELLENDVNEPAYNIIAFDISYYLESKNTIELRRFINRLDPYQKKYIFVFRIPFLEKKAHDDICNILSDMMLIRTIKIPPHNDCIIMESIWDHINENDFFMSPEGMDIIYDKIHQEKMDGRFYGFKTAEKISHEIILKKIANDSIAAADGSETDSYNIKPEDLDGLLNRQKLKATGYKALEELVGMEKITERIKEIIAQVKVSLSNDKLDRPCIHMRFTGAPGTGKTTVARIIGQIMREEGILRKGSFFEYTARDLIAEYVGQTAVKTATICRDSYGSVLFIDEAYALYEGDHKINDYGKEAITTLISEMENHRDDMLLIMAGYTDDMETLMKANPGLRSRMPHIIHFPNYSREQLADIFMLMVRKHFEFTPELESEARQYFADLSDEYLGSKEFANARFVRNLYERTWSKAALRVSLEGNLEITLTKEDFIAACGEKEFSEKLETKKKLGF